MRLSFRVVGGSSPLTRGALSYGVSGSPNTGLIPAHAGSTLISGRRHAGVGAHPRSRGEHGIEIINLPHRDGSSPLTRGAHDGRSCTPSYSGLIPAHAGSTGPFGVVDLRPSAHPRSRGEHISSAIKSRNIMGSSPLTRGALLCPRSTGPGVGLIPAHAGSTDPGASRVEWDGAHPRSRGEHQRWLKNGTMDMGSSPLTRGAPVLDADPVVGWRLIPAHAGSTARDDLRRAAIAAHPRSRGEHLRSSVVRLTSRGSSPLTRGALLSGPSKAMSMGLIPAHAGSTHPTYAVVWQRRAHPRSRGEHWCVPVLLTLFKGSSPLTRGALVLSGFTLTHQGLIPAHAGSTRLICRDRLLKRAHPRSRGEHPG